jgi:hypothetical protein
MVLADECQHVCISTFQNITQIVRMLLLVSKSIAQKEAEEVCGIINDSMKRPEMRVRLWVSRDQSIQVQL